MFCQFTDSGGQTIYVNLAHVAWIVEGQGNAHWQIKMVDGGEFYVAPSDVDNLLSAILKINRSYSRGE